MTKCKVIRKITLADKLTLGESSSFETRYYKSRGNDTREGVHILSAKITECPLPPDGTSLERNLLLEDSYSTFYVSCLIGLCYRHFDGP